MRGKTDGAAVAPVTIPRTRIEKLERFWRKGSEASRKIAARALAKKDHETAIIMGTFAIAYENAAMHLYAVLHGDKLLKKLRRRAARPRP